MTLIARSADASDAVSNPRAIRQQPESEKPLQNMFYCAWNSSSEACLEFAPAISWYVTTIAIAMKHCREAHPHVPCFGWLEIGTSLSIQHLLRFFEVGWFLGGHCETQGRGPTVKHLPFGSSWCLGSCLSRPWRNLKRRRLWLLSPRRKRRHVEQAEIRCEKWR